MRLQSLAAFLFVAGDLAAATPISCSEVCTYRLGLIPSLPRPCLVFPCPGPTNNFQLKRDLILKGELPPEACCSYGRCLGDVVIAMF